MLINITERIDVKGEIYILNPDRIIDECFNSMSVDRNYEPDEAVIAHFDFDNIKEFLLKVNYTVREIGYLRKNK